VEAGHFDGLYEPGFGVGLLSENAVEFAGMGGQNRVERNVVEQSLAACNAVEGVGVKHQRPVIERQELFQGVDRGVRSADAGADGDGVVRVRGVNLAYGEVGV